MALKQDLDAIKDELGTQEQFLEKIIKGERFFKKYKIPLITGTSIIILAFGAYKIQLAIDENHSKVANESFSKLLTDPNDAKALKNLQENSNKLFSTYQFYKANMDKNEEKLTKLMQDNNLDPLLKELIKFEQGNDSLILSQVQTLIKAYSKLKDGKISEAKSIFATIPLDSPLHEIAKRLEHFKDIK